MNRLTTAGLAIIALMLTTLSGCTNTGPGLASNPSQAVAASYDNSYMGVNPATCWQTPLDATLSAPSEQQRVARIHLDMGVGYMREGAFEVAAKELKIAQSLEPKNAKIHNAKALLHLRLGDQNLANQSYQTALELDPADPEIHNNYGVFLCGREQLKLAQEHFQCAISNPLYRTPFMAYTNAGLCAMKEPDIETAEQYFRTSLQLYGGQATPHLELAKLSFDRGELDRAERHYRSYKKMARHTLDSLRIGMQIAKARGDLNAYASLELLRRSMLSEQFEMQP